MGYSYRHVSITVIVSIDRPYFFFCFFFALVVQISFIFLLCYSPAFFHTEIYFTCFFSYRNILSELCTFYSSIYLSHSPCLVVFIYAHSHIIFQRRCSVLLFSIDSSQILYFSHILFLYLFLFYYLFVCLYDFAIFLIIALRSLSLSLSVFVVFLLIHLLLAFLSLKM